MMDSIKQIVRVVAAVGVMVITLVVVPSVAEAQAETDDAACQILGIEFPSAVCSIGGTVGNTAGAVAGAAGDALSALPEAVLGQIAAIINGTVLMLAEGVGGFAIDTLTLASTWWFDVPPIVPNLSQLGNWGATWSTLTSIFFTLGFFYALIQILANDNMRSGRRYVAALFTYAWVTSAVVGAVQGLNELSHFIAQQLIGGAPEIPDLAGLLVLSGGPIPFLIVAAFLFVSSLISLVFVIAQQVALVVAMFFAPLVAAGRAMPWSEAWLPYWTGHVFALNLWLVAAAAIWRLGMEQVVSGEIGGTLIGLVLLAMSGFSWLFVSPFISKMLPGGSSGGGGSGSLAGAVVAVVGLRN